MTFKIDFARKVATGVAVAALGLIAFDLAPAAAKPPSWAPAHGYRSKHSDRNWDRNDSRYRDSRYYGDRYNSGRYYGDRYESGRYYGDRYGSSSRYYGSRTRSRWDIDGDGRRNSRDYDRDGDGVRNSRDRHPDNPRRR